MGDNAVSSKKISPELFFNNSIITTKPSRALRGGSGRTAPGTRTQQNNLLSDAYITRYNREGRVSGENKVGDWRAERTRCSVGGFSDPSTTLFPTIRPSLPHGGHQKISFLRKKF